MLKADGWFSCGFRSHHSCGAAVDLHHLPFPLVIFRKSPFTLLHRSWRIAPAPSRLRHHTLRPHGIFAPCAPQYSHFPGKLSTLRHPGLNGGACPRPEPSTEPSALVRPEGSGLTLLFDELRVLSLPKETVLLFFAFKDGAQHRRMGQIISPSGIDESLRRPFSRRPSPG
jgi:hypothetical protein